MSTPVCLCTRHHLRWTVSESTSWTWSLPAPFPKRQTHGNNVLIKSLKFLRIIILSFWTFGRLSVSDNQPSSNNKKIKIILFSLYFSVLRPLVVQSKVRPNRPTCVLEENCTVIRNPHHPQLPIPGPPGGVIASLCETKAFVWRFQRLMDTFPHRKWRTQGRRVLAWCQRLFNDLVVDHLHSFSYVFRPTASLEQIWECMFVYLMSIHFFVCFLASLWTHSTLFKMAFF